MRTDDMACGGLCDCLADTAGHCIRSNPGPMAAALPWTMLLRVILSAVHEAGCL